MDYKTFTNTWVIILFAAAGLFLVAYVFTALRILFRRKPSPIQKELKS